MLYGVLCISSTFVCNFAPINFESVHPPKQGYAAQQRVSMNRHMSIIQPVVGALFSETNSTD